MADRMDLRPMRVNSAVADQYRCSSYSTSAADLPAWAIWFSEIHNNVDWIRASVHLVYMHSHGVLEGVFLFFLSAYWNFSKVLKNEFLFNFNIWWSSNCLDTLIATEDLHDLHDIYELRIHDKSVKLKR